MLRTINIASLRVRFHKKLSPLMEVLTKVSFFLITTCMNKFSTEAHLLYSVHYVCTQPFYPCNSSYGNVVSCSLFG